LTPVAPPADVLMLLQPAPSGWQETVGIIGAGIAAAFSDACRWLAVVGAGKASGADSAAPGSRLAAALPDANEDVVDVVTNGPLSRLQPLAQPVAAGPTNVGEDTPRLDLVTPARAVVAADAPLEAASSTAASDSINNSGARHLRKLDLGIIPPRSGPHAHFLCRYSGPYIASAERVKTSAPSG
jgi:hypothetical protein